MFQRLTYIKIFLIIFSTINAQRDPNCPPCENISCRSSISPNKCPPGQFFSLTAGVCGCCPNCRGGILKGEMCSPVNPSQLCAPGLECERASATCILNKNDCVHTYHLDTSVNWAPECDENGQYKAKQCEGDVATGRCFCYDEQGERIFGMQFRKDANDMICECSRLVNRLEEEGRSHTIHCLENGNFDELQCDGGICWCADEKTGHIQLNTIAVQESLWTMLPCCKLLELCYNYKN